MEMKLGKRFRELRTKQGFSLVETSKDIISEPTLSRWETGKGPMDIDQIPALLKRINCTINDLFLFDDDQIEKQIVKLYDNKDKAGLYELTQNLLVVFQERINNYDCLFDVVMACNYYQKLTNENLLTNLVIKKLSRRISDVKIWTENIVALIEFALPLISNDSLFEIAVNIRNTFPNMKNNSKTNIIYRVLAIYVEIIGKLIQNGEYGKAYILLQHAETITWPDYCCNLKIKFQFNYYLFNSKVTGNTDKINNFITTLKAYSLRDIL